jgi:hypothetical protein
VKRDGGNVKLHAEFKYQTGNVVDGGWHSMTKSQNPAIMAGL